MTRWLSLGLCLARLLEIWESLKDYMDYSVTNSKDASQKKKETYFVKILNNKTFFLKVLFLSDIIGKLNETNTKLQSQHTYIGKIRNYIEYCFNSILQRICASVELEVSFEDMLSLNFEDSAIQQQWFLDTENFIQKISNIIDIRFKDLALETEQKEFDKFAKEYLSKLLNLLKQYMPFKNSLIKVVDFIELNDKYSILEKKVEDFNTYLGIFDKEEFKSVYKELLSYKDIIKKYGDEGLQINFEMWNKIRKSQNYPCLVKIAEIIFTLPTSSADV